MRTLVKNGLVAVLAIAAAACTKPQAPRDPIGGNDPKPQAPINNPEPQAPNAVIGPQDPKPQAPINNPTPQTSSFQDPTVQQPVNDPQVQKPLFPVDNNENIAPKAQAKATNLNDGQILAVAMAANTGEVEAAELARKNATSADVKQFAAMMMTHHRDAMSKERQVQDKAKVQIAENDVSTSIKNENDSALATLRNQSGKEFDRMYINAQVKMHRDVLQTIDRQLLPDASNNEVKSLLQEMRKNVASHLAKAEQLQKKLDPSMAAAHQDDKKDAAKAKSDTKKTDKTDTSKKQPDTSRSNTDKPNPNEK